MTDADYDGVHCDYDIPLSPTLHGCVQKILVSYIETALWAELNDEGKAWQDAGYTFSDVSSLALKKATIDIRKFLSGPAGEIISVRYDNTDVGRDLWLTRNGHGCGFWDGGYEDVLEDGEILTKAAHALGEQSPYEHDGQIEF